MSETVDQLVERIKQRDRQALVDFIELHRPQLLAFINRIIGDSLARKVEPSDILQELTLSALNSLSDVELGDRDPFSWLCQLGERRVIDAHRRYLGAQKRSAAKEVGLESPAGNVSGRGLIDMVVASITSPSKAFSRDQREIRLQSAMEDLSDECRLALKLRYVDGLPSKQIAEQLGKSDGAIRVMLTRSLKQLGQILGPDGAPS